MSPDPYGGSYDSGNPQSMNRYAYVLNNPLASLDPLGLVDVSDPLDGGDDCDPDDPDVVCFVDDPSDDNGNADDGSGGDETISTPNLNREPLVMNG
jgi:hypothetical protein